MFYRARRGGAVFTCLVLLLLSAVAPFEAAGDGEERVTVERIEPNGRAGGTLPYLHANRDFFRARLDRLREIYGTVEQGDAIAFDERYLKLLELLADAKGARDSVAAGEGELAGLEYFRSLSDLEWLEVELDRMEELLAAQEERLAWLEKDYSSLQKTALMVYLRGLPSDGDRPEGIVIGADGEQTIRIPLDSSTCASLQKGGVVQVFHRRVEPRLHRLEIGFEGSTWTVIEPAALSVETARDRLTLLELDLAGLSRIEGAVNLQAHSWVR